MRTRQGWIAFMVVCGVGGWCAAPASADTFKSGPVTYVTASSPVANTDTATLTAECPSPRRATAVGASLTGRISDMYLINTDLDLAPDDAATTGLVNDTGDPHTGHVTAICLGAPFSSSLTYKQTTGNVGSGTTGTGTSISCAESGDRITGLGFGIDDPIEDTQLDELGLHFTSRTPDENQANLSFNKFGAAKTYLAQASCLPAGTGKLARRSNATVLYPGETATVKAACPKNSRVVGGGEQGPSKIATSRPYDGSDKDKTPDDGWLVRASTVGLDAVAAQAICLRKA